MESTITRWHPIADLSELLDQALTRFGDGYAWNPRIDVVKKERYLRRERRYGSFSRSMALPEGVKSDDIEATTSDGVLELRIPIPAPKEKPAKTVKVEPKS
jgi:Hsp20/alpha crystallin family